MRVLLVEDDADLAEAVAEYLEIHGAQCDFAWTGESGLTMALEGGFDVVVLDLMLPRMSGLKVCRRMREKGCELPVLMLTAANTNDVELEGFLAGTDDFVAKPCAMPLLWARIQALHRRATSGEQWLQVGDLKYCSSSAKAEREGQAITLGPTACKLLEALMRASPKILSRAELERIAWPDSGTSEGNFNVHLHQLRRAVDRPFSSSLIHTVVGEGLCLRVQSGDNMHA